MTEHCSVCSANKTLYNVSYKQTTTREAYCKSTGTLTAQLPVADFLSNDKSLALHET
jgi:phosphopantetheinyl transferase